MEFKIYRDPDVIEVLNPVKQSVHDDIFKEVLANKSNFSHATLGSEGKVNPKIRTNMVFYPDNIYLGDERKGSKILSGITDMIHNDEIKQVVTSFNYPFTQLGTTNFHETQISRYGDEGQKYDWHIDSLSNKPMSRIITYVYYFGYDRYEGGEINFSRSPIIKSELVEKDIPLSLKPKPNSLYIFSSNTAHAVSPTKSSTEFKEGRFSINCWIGYNV
jgi:hypothetical protein